MDKTWVQVVIFLVVAVPAVAILARLMRYLSYAFKAPPGRSAAEEMAMADWKEALLLGVKPYSSYEEWRQDILSGKPLDEILGRVPPGFFDKKPEEKPRDIAGGMVGATITEKDLQGAVPWISSIMSTNGFSGASGISGYIGVSGVSGYVGISGYIGKADADAMYMARQRLLEIQARIRLEDFRVKAGMEQHPADARCRVEELRQRMATPVQPSHEARCTIERKRPADGIVGFHTGHFTDGDLRQNYGEGLYKITRFAQDSALPIEYEVMVGPAFGPARNPQIKKYKTVSQEPCYQCRGTRETIHQDFLGRIHKLPCVICQ